MKLSIHSTFCAFLLFVLIQLPPLYGAGATHQVSWQNKKMTFRAEIETKQMSIEINGKTFTHPLNEMGIEELYFSSDIVADFDHDQQEDLVVIYKHNFPGPRVQSFYAVFSSKKQELQIYTTSTSTSWWREGGGIPKLKSKSGFLFTSLGSLPEHVNKLVPKDGFIPRSDVISYLHVFRWDGEKFSAQPWPAFHKQCAKRIKEKVSDDKSRKDLPWLRKVDLAILKDYEDAGNGKPSPLTQEKNSGVQLLLVADLKNLPQKATPTKNKTSSVKNTMSGIWEVVEKPTSRQDWKSIVWKYDFKEEDGVLKVSGKKIQVDGKRPSSGELRAKATGQLRFSDGQWRGEIRETNHRGRTFSSDWSLIPSKDGRTFHANNREKGKVATKLTGKQTSRERR